MRRALALLLLLAPLPVGLARATDSTLRAGFSKADLTPAWPVRLAGPWERGALPTSIVRDPIEARVLVLEAGLRKLAIVATDLHGIPRELKAQVVERLAEARGLGAGNVLLTATGNPTAPAGLSRAPLFLDARGGHDAGLLADLAQRLADAVARADDAMRPARLHRTWLDAPQVLSSRDSRLPVVRIDDDRARPMGLVMVVGANPSSAGWHPPGLSAGWTGATRRLIEARFPGSCALLLQGAFTYPPVHFDGADAAEAGEIQAKAVAAVAIHAAEIAPTEPPAPDELLVRRAEVRIPPSTIGALLGDGVEGGLAPAGTRTTEVLRVRLADYAFLALPGEPTPGAADAVQRFAPRDRRDRELFVVGGADDQLGVLDDGHDGDDARAGSWADVVGPEFLGATLAALGRPPPPWARKYRATREVDRDVYAVGGGWSHGTGLKELIRDLLRAAEPGLIAAFERRLPEEFAEGAREMGLSTTDAVLLWLTQEARRLTRRLSRERADEMREISRGADVPYESILIENWFLPTPLPGTSVYAAGASTTLGQAVHLVGVAGGDSGALRDRAVVLVREPRDGHPYACVTWPGMVGLQAAIGAQGLSVSGEEAPEVRSREPDAPPLSFLLREVIEKSDDLPGALARLGAAPGAIGRRVTVVDGNHREARVFEGSRVGLEPGDRGIVSPRDLVAERWLDRARGHADARTLGALASDLDLVGKQTLFAAIFQPQTGRFAVSLGDDLDGDPTVGVLGWRSLRLDDLLSKDVPAPGRSPPRPERFGPATLGTPQRFSKIVRLPVEFDSPRPSGVARNDRVRAALFLPADDTPIRGAVIQLPAWRERDLAAESLVATALAVEGFATFLLPLPWQADRAAPGVAPGEWTLSPDLARTREAWMQGLADVRWASEYLEQARHIGVDRQAIFGISLGGHVAAVAYGAYPERFRAGVFVLAGGDLELLLRSADPRLAEFRNRVFAEGVSLEDVTDLLSPLDPARWADPARKDGVFQVGARGDEIVPAGHVEALSKAYGQAPILWIDGDHTSGIAQAPRILAAVIAHLKARLGGS